MRSRRAAAAAAVVAAALLVLAALLASGVLTGEGSDVETETEAQGVSAADPESPDASEAEEVAGELLGEVSEELLDEVPDEAEDALRSAETSVYESELTLVEEGAAVLEAYRARGDCVLASAGYLDLTGGTWGCVTQGEGWVEICIVQEDAGGDGCSVVVLHMDVEDVADAVGGDG